MNVRFQNVTKSFGGSMVVDHLDLAVSEGEFVVLLGPSGCGKTTTLRMLAGLEDTTSGDIFIGEERVNDIPTRYRDVAMVFQSYALYPHMTVADNIAYPLVVRKTPAAQIASRVGRAAEMLEIGELLKRKPRELSGGERQRVALARAHHCNPVRQRHCFSLVVSDIDRRRAQVVLKPLQLAAHLNSEFGVEV